jgi:hypothetical protein
MVTQNLDNGELVFQPVYEKTLYWAFFFLAVILVIGVLAVIDTGAEDPVFVISLVFLGLLVVVVPFKTARRIRFGTKLIVERYFFPSREFEFTEIVDIGAMSVKTTRGSISLTHMRNVDELYGILNEYVDNGVISEHQLEGDLLKRESLSWQATAYTSVIAMIITIALVYLCPACKAVRGEILFVVVSLILYFPVKYVCKRRSF